MANFSNATEYMAYVEKWCVKCYHYGTDIGVDDDGCPILDIHQQLMQCRNDVMPWGEEETEKDELEFCDDVEPGAVEYRGSTKPKATREKGPCR